MGLEFALKKEAKARFGFGSEGAKESDSERTAKRKSVVRLGNQRFFATDSVAAKPVKPCDGGVFQGLNLLSKKE